MSKKYVSGITALLLGVSAMSPAAFSDIAVVKASDTIMTGRAGEYDYELFLMNDMGEVTFDPQVDPYSAVFSDYDDAYYLLNRLFGANYKWSDYGDICIKYDADINTKKESGKNSTYTTGVYGFLENPAVEFYIVDGWGDWRPPGLNDPVDTVVSDGVVYDIYRREKIGMIGIHATQDEKYQQIWSVRRDNQLGKDYSGEISNSINFTDHLKAWSKILDIDDALLYSAGFIAEGYRSGTMDVTVNSFELKTQKDPEIPGAVPQISGKSGDYTYSVWLCNGEGDLSFNPETDPKKASVSGNYEDVQYRFKRDFDCDWEWRSYGDVKIRYDAELNMESGDQNIYYSGIYGWLRDPMTEFFVIDSWGDWTPPGEKEPLETVEIDGEVYDIYKLTSRSEHSEWNQFWSVRRNNPGDRNSSGKISTEINLSDHLKVWSKYDTNINFAGFTDAGFFAESYQSGKFDVTLNSFELTAENDPEKDDEKPVTPEDYISLKDVVAGQFNTGITVPLNKLPENSEFLAYNFDIIRPVTDFSFADYLLEGDLAGDGKYTDIDVDIDFSDIPKYAQYAAAHDLVLDAGTFIDVRKFPDWFFTDFEADPVSKEILQKRLESAVKNMFAAFGSYENLKLGSVDIYCDKWETPDIEKDLITYDYWTEAYGDESFIEDIFRYCSKYAPEGCTVNLKVPYQYYLDNKTDDYVSLVSDLKEKEIVDGVSLGFEIPDSSANSKNTIAKYKENYKKAIEKYIAAGCDVRISDIIYKHNDQSKTEMLSELIEFYASHGANISDVIFDSDTTIDILSDGWCSPTKVYYSIKDSVEAVMNNTTDDILYGDANGDGTVNAVDLVYSIKYMLGDAAGEMPVEMDFDRDGKITVADIVLMKNYILNK